MSDITKVAVLPDIHAPLQHDRSLTVALEFVKDYKPDVLVQLGDMCDYSSLSRFDLLKERELIGMTTEVRGANEVLDAIDAVVPARCQKIMCEGNHDRRPETYNLNNWTKGVRKVTGKKYLPLFYDAYALKLRGWDWVEEGKCYKIGKALFTHGWYVNRYHAAKTVQKWFKTIFYGHTHDYQVHTINGMDGRPNSGVSLGTLSRFDLGYLKGIPPNWCHMFAHIEFFGNGLFTPHMIPIIKGRFCDGGKVWG